jgi:enterochelin esterase family protein
MKWLWRQEKHTPTYDTSGDLGGDLTLLNLLIPGESWELVVDKLGFADALCADREGNVYYCDMREPGIYRIDVLTGEKRRISEESVSGLEFSPDASKLYACQGSQKRVLEIDLVTGESRTIAQDVQPNDLAVTSDGMILITETGKKQVTRIDPQTGTAMQVDLGIEKPNGIALSNDGGTLAVSDYGGEFTWTFRVLEDSNLDAKMPTLPMRLPIDFAGDFKFNEAPPYVRASKGDGMAVDKKGRFYVTSELGVQIFDPTGRPCGVLPKVNKGEPLTTCILAGAEHSTLYIAHGSKIYRRKLKVD